MVVESWPITRVGVGFNVIWAGVFRRKTSKNRTERRSGLMKNGAGKGEGDAADRVIGERRLLLSNIAREEDIGEFALVAWSWYGSVVDCKALQQKRRNETNFA